MISPPAFAAAVSWIDGTSFWDIGTNWSTGAVPSALDDVTINVGGTHTITIRTTGGPFGVNSLSMPGDEILAITGSTLTVNGSFASSSATTMAGGTLVLNGASSMAALTQDGQIAGSGNLTLTGSASIVNGGHSGTPATTAQGITSISGTLALDGGRTFRNEGTVNQTGNVDLNSRRFGSAEAGNGTVLNATGAIWNAAGDHLIIASTQGGTDSGAGATFINQGTFNKQSGGTTDVRVGLVNDGAIDVQQGTLQFSTGGSLTHNGVLTIASGALLNFSSNGAVTQTIGTPATTIQGTLQIGGDNVIDFAQAHTLSGSGTLEQTFGQVIGANLTLGPNITFNVSNGGHSGAATTTARGTTNIAIALTLDGGRTFRNEGTVNQTGNVDLNFRNGSPEAGNGTVLNAAGGTWNAGGAGQFILASTQGAGDTGAGAVFTNQGTFNRHNAGTTDVRVGFVNDATINVQQGTLQFSTGGSLQNRSAGVVNIDAGGTLLVASAFTNEGTMNVAAMGTLRSTHAEFVNAGLLRGAGSVVTMATGALVNEGRIDPGTGIGSMQIMGDLVQADAGRLEVELASLASFDKLLVSEDVTLDGNIVVRNAGYLPVVGHTFVVLEFDGQRVGGSEFDDVVTMGYGPGIVFTAIYNPNNVTLSVAAIPEPETWAMLVVGLGMVGYAVRRRGGKRLLLPL